MTVLVEGAKLAFPTEAPARRTNLTEITGEPGAENLVCFSR
jgi:hypothetical protein